MSGCILWAGPVSRNGYGRVSIDGINEYAHRVAYETHYGAIQNGTHVHHVCGVRLCVNHEHLAAIPAGEHAGHHKRPECRHGHPFSPENTYMHPNGGMPYRVCLTCQRESARRYRERIA